MIFMKVIFIKNLSGQGRVGEVKEVSEGYARNFLMPRGLADVATAAKLQELEAKKNEKAAMAQKERAGHEKLVRRLPNLTLEFRRKADKSGTIFGSVTSEDIVRELSDRTKIRVGAASIKLEHPLKKAGEHEVVVDFGDKVTGRIKIRIVGI